MASWQTQTIRVFSAMPQAGWAASKSRWHGLVPGLVSAAGQSLVAGNIAILIVPLPDESRLPYDKGNTQLAVETNPVVSWEMLGREGYASPMSNTW